MKFFGYGQIVLCAKEHQKKNRAGENEIPEGRDGEARKGRGRDRARDDAHVVARVNDVHRGLLPTPFDFDSRHVHRDVEKPESEPHKRRGDGKERDERKEDEPELVRRGARLFLERRNAGGEETVGKARSGKEEKSGEARLSVGEGLHTKIRNARTFIVAVSRKNPRPEEIGAGE